LVSSTASAGEDGALAHLRLAQLAPRREEVAQVEAVAEQRVALLAQRLLLQVDLHAARLVAQVEEQAAAVVAARRDAAGHADHGPRLPVGREQRQDLGHRLAVGDRRRARGIGIEPRRPEPLQLGQTVLGRVPSRRF
jgi:hypothetical protein